MFYAGNGGKNVLNDVEKSFEDERLDERREICWRYECLNLPSADKSSSHDLSHVSGQSVSKSPKLS